MRVPPPPAPARAGIALSLPQQGKGGGAWSAGQYPAIALPCGLRARQGGKVGDRAVAVLVDDQCAAERQVGRIGRDVHLHSRGAFQILGDHGERRAGIDAEPAGTGRAWGRERVWPDVKIRVGALTLKKKKT